MNEVTARLESLERRVARQRWAMVALAAALAAAVLPAWSPSGAAPEVLRARRLEVVNDAGEALVVLAQKDGRGVVATQTPAGRLLVTLTSTADGSGLVAVGNAGGQRLVELSGRSAEGAEAESATTGVVSAYNGRGQVAVSLLASRGAGLVQTFNAKQQPAAMLGGIDDRGVLALFDAAGKVRHTVPPER
jgi:hypothetical protein